MKVRFDLIRGGSGSDIWTMNLKRALEAQGVETELRVFPHMFQFLPQALRPFTGANDADIVHTNSWSGFAFKCDVPMVVTEHLVVHDKDIDGYKAPLQRIFHTMVYGFEARSFDSADIITSVSEHTRGLVKAVFGRESICIPNGIDTDVFFPMDIHDNAPGIDRRKTVLMFAGNMTLRKGRDLLPGIMKELGEDFVLLCASGRSGNVKSPAGNIKIVGNLSQEEMRYYYNLCDIFVFPSRAEGLSLTLLEAMACAKPVVACDVSSMPEAIVDGKGGLLAQKDDVKDIAEKIRILAGDKILRKDMGCFNRERSEEYFSLKDMAFKYKGLYERILKGGAQ